MEDRLKFRGVEDLSRGSHLQNGLLKEDDLVSIMAQGGEIVGGEEDGEIIFDEWLCPCCRTRYEVDYDDYKFCPNCGQAIDWSVEHDTEMD